MTADQLLSQLGSAMNLPALSFDANGCARVVVDGRIAVNFESDSSNGAVQVYSTIAPLPMQGRETIFQALLEGNLFGAQTLGATLAIDSLYGEIVLCRSVPLDAADAASFSAIVEKFVAAAEEWIGKFQRGELASAAVAGGPGAAVPPVASADTLEPRVHAHFLRV